jgi:hypothetical protein
VNFRVIASESFGSVSVEASRVVFRARQARRQHATILQARQIQTFGASPCRRTISKSPPDGNLDAKARRRKENQENRMNLELMNSGTQFRKTGHEFAFS